MTTAIVLAAGVGRRLGTPPGRPKWLTPLGNGLTPASLQLEGCARSGVIDRIVVVSGHGEDAVSTFLAASAPVLPVEVIRNPHYADRNNWFSLLVGLDAMASSERAVVLNSDLCASADWFAAAISGAAGVEGGALVIDGIRPLTEEAMKAGSLSAGNGFVDTLTKDPIPDPIGEYVGVTGLDPLHVAGLAAHLRAFVDSPSTHDNWYEHGIQDHARTGGTYAVVPVPDSNWVEVDTREDLALARSLFAP